MEKVIRYTYSKMFHKNSKITLQEQFCIVLSVFVVVIIAAITLLLD